MLGQILEESGPAHRRGPLRSASPSRAQRYLASGFAAQYVPFRTVFAGALCCAFFLFLTLSFCHLYTRSHVLHYSYVSRSLTDRGASLTEVT